ncbi:polysaccharide biosynthesis C-terminal domain-containing protein [Faecalicoccus acidiformans]|uniref:oligosaccharide flippase family protein n=1 Tax=Faecalicoccus acidiformans TaxID=915173 RepID=UPI003207D77D
MNCYKYLIKNIGLLTLSSFATKLISFILVPLYTNILTTTEYGTYDYFNTTIGLLIPILTLNIQEAVMRFSIDTKWDRKSIVTVATRYLLFSNMFVIVGLLLNNLIGFSEIVKQYPMYFFLMFFSQSLSGMITMYVRGIDKITELSLSSLVAAIITILLNVFFLAFFHLGLTGYFLANIIGPLFQSLYLIIKSKAIRDIRFKKKYKNEAKDMINYSRPLIANSISWWINNASDRYIVIFFCGLAENGIYSVASKIPSILNIFQTIFNQAWTLSAVKDFDPEDSNGFFTNTYRVYNCMLVVVCSVIIVCDKILANFLYAKDFFTAWRYVPWLTIAILFGALSGYIGGLFAAVKDSKIFAKSTIYGAITNIVLNLIFTPFIGASGAAIATTISYFEVWVFRYWQSTKYVKMRINIIRDIFSYLLLICQSIVLLCNFQNITLYFFEILLFIIILLLYSRDVFLLINKVKESITSRGVFKQ